ncbi:MAG: SlyX family protein [Verrucomicrobiota bacterium]
MSEEIFDVVNERDEVIGRETRREVHRLGLKHRAVHVLVFNRRGELFLQKRSWKKDKHPGTWDSSASGHLASGEDYDTAARREVREEIGLELTECPERLFKINACPDTGMEFVWVYRSESEGPFRLQPEEIETGTWFSPEHLDHWLAEKPSAFAPSFPLIWSLYRDNLTTTAHPLLADAPEASALASRLAVESPANQSMDTSGAERLEKLETHLAFLERQVEQLNEVVVEQAKILHRLQTLVRNQAESIETMELERIKSTNPKPPHYQ